MKHNSAVLTIMCALFKNKFRFAEGASKKKKAGFAVAFAFLYLLVATFIVIISVSLGLGLNQMGVPHIGYLLILLVGAIIVLIFGIVFLVTTLYLAKDTDFYSALPVSGRSVFIAKTLYVYLSEAALVAAVMLPAMIAYGISANGEWYYYVISLFALPIVPSISLLIAAIFAVPVMYLAGKLKHRNIIALIFYCILFFALAGMYMWFCFSMPSGDGEITNEQLQSLIDVLTVVGYVLYPYTCLSQAVFGYDMFYIGVGGSVVINLLIFVGISVALGTVLVMLGKFMYGQSAKSNNQSSGDKSKHDEYCSTNTMLSLVKREYSLAMRTTSTAFQCFASAFLPIVMAVFLGLAFRSMFSVGDEVIEFMSDLSGYMGVSVLFIVMFTVMTAPITSVSREGTGLASLKALPIPPINLVMAKTLAWSIFSVPSGIIAAIIIYLFNLNVIAPYFAALFIVLCAILPFVVSLFGVLWDLAAPKLKWSDPIQAVKHNTHATFGQIGLLLTGAAAFIAALISAIVTSSVVTFTVVFLSIAYAEILALIGADIFLLKKVNAYYYRTEF